MDNISDNTSDMYLTIILYICILYTEPFKAVCIRLSYYSHRAHLVFSDLAATELLIHSGGQFAKLIPATGKDRQLYIYL